MAESSSSSSVSERPTSHRKPGQQEKEESHQCSLMVLPKNPRKLTAEVCHLSRIHFLPIILKLFFTYSIKLPLRKIYPKNNYHSLYVN